MENAVDNNAVGAVVIMWLRLIVVDVGRSVGVGRVGGARMCGLWILLMLIWPGRLIERSVRQAS